MGDNVLTSEQKEFLAECEEEFKDRYTEKDKDFMRIKTEMPKNPPIVDPWYGKPRRNYDSKGQQDRNRSRGHNYQWNHSNNKRNEKWERHAGKHHMHNRQKMY